MTAGDVPVGADGYPDPDAGVAADADADTAAGLAADPAGRAPAVRPFLVTAGRVAGTEAGTPIPIETQVVATAAGLRELDGLSFERRDIVAVCRQPQSLAEIAAKLRLHLNVVRVLAEDLAAGRHLSVYVPNADTAQDVSVLRRVIDGLRSAPDSRGARRDTD